MQSMTRLAPANSCGPKQALGQRPLISDADAAELETTFKALANATRLRLLHALVLQPGLSVTALSQAIGMKPQAVSNQLQRLMGCGILARVRDGTSIYYRVVDPCITGQFYFAAKARKCWSCGCLCTRWIRSTGRFPMYASQGQLRRPLPTSDPSCCPRNTNALAAMSASRPLRPTRSARSVTISTRTCVRPRRSRHALGVAGRWPCVITS